jgi:hypothetical protein
MPSSAATVAALRPLSFQWFTASSLYSAVKSVLPADGLLIWVFIGFLRLVPEPVSVKLGQP